MNILQKSWGNIPKESASKYLDGIGNPSAGSRTLLINIIKKISAQYGTKLIDIGCGNGNLLKYIKENIEHVEYTGIDFSENLIEAAKISHPQNSFILDDVINPLSLSDSYNIAVYSHVLEMLSSPEESLYHIAKLSDVIIIRFFEPPIHQFDSVQILRLNHANNDSPYIRRKISKTYYQLILHNINAKEVHVYKDHTSNDQIHVIFLNTSKKK